MKPLSSTFTAIVVTPGAGAWRWEISVGDAVTMTLTLRSRRCSLHAKIPTPIPSSTTPVRIHMTARSIRNENRRVARALRRKKNSRTWSSLRLRKAEPIKINPFWTVGLTSNFRGPKKCEKLRRNEFRG